MLRILSFRADAISLLAVTFLWCLVDPAVAAEPLFKNLRKALVREGIDKRLVSQVYGHPNTRLELQILAFNLKRKESTLSYDRFLTDFVVAEANRYLSAHRETLVQTHGRFGVDPKTVVAILMVETSLGRYVGKASTVNVLSTMAVADRPWVVKQVLKSLGPDGRDPVLRKKVRDRLRRRSERGFRELIALFRYIEDIGLDPIKLCGSSEGAIGIPQFMPSNITRYGRDGDQDGRVDLFDHEDAIASVASFLQAHQWNTAESAQDRKSVIFAYNHSNYYAEAILSLAERLGE